MTKFNPQFVYDESGKKVGVVLRLSEFEKLIDKLEDISDYEYALKHQDKKTKGRPLDEVMAEILSR